MNVLFITSWYPREDNSVSGVFVREHAKAVSLIDRIAVLYGYQSDKVKRLYEVDIENESNLKIFRIRYKKLPKILSNILYLYSMFRAFQKIRKQFKPDIIHAHVYMSGFLGIIFGKLYNIPVIITDHAEILEKPDSKKQKLKNIAKMLIARFALSNAQLLLPASKSLRRHIESLGIQNDFKILPNIVDTEIFYPVSKEHRNIKKILFVGRLHPVKGIEYLLDALGELRKKRDDFELDIVGYGAYEDEYKKKALDLGLSKKVKFHGKKTKTEVAKFMQECDFLVFPSLVIPNIEEGWGIVLVEALACGRPVVTTTSECEAGEIGIKEYGILVPPRDTNSLLKAIDYMLDNYYKYPSEEVVRYVRRYLSPEAIGKMLHRIYVEVAEKYRGINKN